MLMPLINWSISTLVWFTSSVAASTAVMSMARPTLSTTFSKFVLEFTSPDSIGKKAMLANSFLR